eukprot:TRINITY_DN17250_c0_g1_i1.p1 TRINITY_DN17250_c0_g1~~TRINITY_DN17250_c0_g1_i1.p1  ORF type:complete len:477 (-),score=70.13 TRINITY_DN17250_c0_g1_i1:239-1669(-)
MYEYGDVGDATASDAYQSWENGQIQQEQVGLRQRPPTQPVEAAAGPEDLPASVGSEAAAAPENLPAPVGCEPDSEEQPYAPFIYQDRPLIARIEDLPLEARGVWCHSLFFSALTLFVLNWKASREAGILGTISEWGVQYEQCDIGRSLAMLLFVILFCILTSVVTWLMVPWINTGNQRWIWFHGGLQLASFLALQLMIAEQSAAPLIAVAASFGSLATLFKNYSTCTNSEAAANNSLVQHLKWACSPVLVHRHFRDRVLPVRWGRVTLKVLKNLMYVLLIMTIYSCLIAGPLSDSHRNKLDVYVEFAVPGFYCWFLGFLATFECGFFVASEIFGPARELRWFGDWWNASSISEFWCKWNITVHDFCATHVYEPLRHQRNLGLAMVFFVSAFFHWVVYAVAFKNLNPAIFIAMLAQAPFLVLTQRFDGTFVGNLLMWVNFVFGITWVGQIYLSEWYHTHPSIMCGTPHEPAASAFTA